MHGKMQMAPQRPSGSVRIPSAPGGGNNRPPPGRHDEDRHYPITLNRRTLLWLIGPGLSALIAVLGAASMFWAKTESHMQRTDIHVKAETKKDAKQARSAMAMQIIKKQNIAIREVKLEQRESIKELGDKLQKEQRAILREVVRARRAAEER
jgi:hypothetical protein